MGPQSPNLPESYQDHVDSMANRPHLHSRVLDARSRLYRASDQPEVAATNVEGNSFVTRLAEGIDHAVALASAEGKANGLVVQDTVMDLADPSDRDRRALNAAFVALGVQVRSLDGSTDYVSASETALNELATGSRHLQRADPEVVQARTASGSYALARNPTNPDSPVTGVVLETGAAGVRLRLDKHPHGWRPMLMVNVSE